MKGYNFNLKRASVAVLTLGLTLSTQWAWAGSKIFSLGTTASRVNGSAQTSGTNDRDPWVAQVWSRGGECLRIAVVAQQADLEATLVSPSGSVWQDDDSNGSARPLIKARTDVRGWYPLVLSSFNGAAINADFTMDITLLPTSSPLCTSPSSPQIRSFAPGQKAAGTPGSKLEGGAN